jgi:DNA-binding HxlR family transcriptional regulator
VIPVDDLHFEALIAQSQALCDALSDEEDGLKREVLAHAGNRWSLAVLHALAVSGTLRHAELGRRLDGVTQRMLTRTLRHMERDGLIVRHDHAELPPRVDYALTPLGRGFLAGMMPLWTWLLASAGEFTLARSRFDAGRHDSGD